MLGFVFDEHLRGRIFEIFHRLNALNGHPLDITIVGDEEGLPLGVDDARLIEWAATEERILVSGDKQIAASFVLYLRSGQHSPGIFQLSGPITAGDIKPIFDFLLLANETTEPHDWADGIHFIPF